MVFPVNGYGGTQPVHTWVHVVEEDVFDIDCYVTHPPGQPEQYHCTVSGIRYPKNSVYLGNWSQMLEKLGYGTVDQVVKAIETLGYRVVSVKPNPIIRAIGSKRWEYKRTTIEVELPSMGELDVFKTKLRNLLSKTTISTTTVQARKKSSEQVARETIEKAVQPRIEPKPQPTPTPAPKTVSETVATEVAMEEKPLEKPSWLPLLILLFALGE